MSAPPDPSRPALGSATHGPHIFDVRELSGLPHFYPRDEHPATYRWREHRRMLAEIYDRSPTRHVGRMLDFVEAQLATFEAGEDEAKRRAWLYIRDRLGLER